MQHQQVSGRGTHAAAVGASAVRLASGLSAWSWWEHSAECTALQASLWKQLARDKDVAAQTGARATPPSRRQVMLTATDSNALYFFPI